MNDNTEFDNISFDMPKNQSYVIKVIGVGGGGSNAINHMFNQGIKGVDFVICNTDAQALESSLVPVKIQLGVSLTEGLGAGANPQVGEQSAVESVEDIKRMLMTNTKMVFITAGMGGGTGTGAAPVIAKMAQELDILTVGIVTIPFQFEGKIRNDQAQRGVEKLRENCDSLIVINNNKLREVYGNLGFKAGFSKADEVLATAARSIAEVITYHYTQNIDLRDAKTVLANSGTAIMGNAVASGNERAKTAISKALDSPLLNDNKIKGAKNVLLLIVSGTEEITIDEIGEVNDYIQAETGSNSANIIMGIGEDKTLDDAVSITIIATGFDAEQQDEIVNTDPKKIIHTLEEEQKAEQIILDTQTQKSEGQTIYQRGPLTKIEKEEPLVRHTLFSEEEKYFSTSISANNNADYIPKTTPEVPFLDYIPTSEFIKNIKVEATLLEEEQSSIKKPLLNEIDVNDFVIVTPENNKPDVITEDIDDTGVVQEQMLMFDMPIHDALTKEDTSQDLELVVKNIKDIDVIDPINVTSSSSATEKEVKHYNLDDYKEKEDELLSAKPSLKTEEEEIVFKTKIVEQTSQNTSNQESHIDPLTSSVSELLKSRAQERRRKMKESNYKFRNNSNIDDIEKQPAYKRMGVELEDTESSNEGNISRVSVNTDNGDLDLRDNNSFLHENVD